MRNIEQLPRVDRRADDAPKRSSQKNRKKDGRRGWRKRRAAGRENSERSNYGHTMRANIRCQSTRTANEMLKISRFNLKIFKFDSKS